MRALKTFVHSKCCGYSLFEVAIVMMIAGVMMAAAAQAYRVYRENQIYTTTTANIERVLNNMNTYLAQNGSYPCPASLTDDRGATTYGKPGDCSVTTVAAGTCAGGICVEETDKTTLTWAAFSPACTEGMTCTFSGTKQIRYGDAEPFFATQTATGSITCDNATFGDPHSGFFKHCEYGVPAGSVVRVRRGFVPFRAMNVPEEMAMDGYGNRLQYAVTERLAVPATFDRNGGAIGIVDGQATPRSVITPEDSGHFMIFSSGPNAIGAYSKEGKLKFACAGAGLDVENCNTGTPAAQKKATYRVANYSTTLGASLFDDTVKHYTSGDIPLWVVSSANRDNIVDNIDAGNSADSHIAIGGAASTEYLLRVTGNIKANTDPVAVTDPTSGSVRANSICNATDGSCQMELAPALLGGSKTVSDPTYYPANATNMNCPAGQYVTKIESGQVSCAPINDAGASCPLTATGQQQYIVSVKNDSGGNRVIVCAPAATSADCNAYNDTICNNPYEQSRPVPAGRDGDIFRVNPVDLTPAEPRDYQAFYELTCKAGIGWQLNGVGSKPGLCQICVAGTVVTGLACDDVDDGDLGAGYWTGGNYDYTEVTGCSPYMTYGASSNYPAACTCTPGPDRTYTDSCPFGQTGTGIVYSSSWVCSGGHAGYWSGYTETSRSCAPDPACTDQTTNGYAYDCPAGYSGTGTPLVNTRQCSTGNWTGWTPTGGPKACTKNCTPSTGTEWDGICPSPKSGKGKQFNYANTCDVDGNLTHTLGSPTGLEDCFNHSWQTISTATGGPYAVAPGLPEAGSSCNIVTDLAGACYTGGYYTYDCSCQ